MSSIVFEETPASCKVKGKKNTRKYYPWLTKIIRWKSETRQPNSSSPCSYSTRNIIDFYGVGKTNDTPIFPCMMQENDKENFRLGYWISCRSEKICSYDSKSVHMTKSHMINLQKSVHMINLIVLYWISCRSEPNHFRK